jgi:hypothetical protein
MYHLYSILVKPKYNINFVRAINTACKKYISEPFVHTCLTDDIEQFKGENFCNVIDISHHDLPTFWNKMLFFEKNGICKDGDLCIFFDLDVKILRNLNPIINHISQKIIVGLNISKINRKYVTKAYNSPGHGRHLTILNSSCMLWIGGEHDDLWKKFSLDKDGSILRYYGNDEFMTFEYPSGYKLLDKKWVLGHGTEKTARYDNKMSSREERLNYK